MEIQKGRGCHEKTFSLENFCENFVERKKCISIFGVKNAFHIFLAGLALYRKSDDVIFVQACRQSYTINLVS